MRMRCVHVAFTSTVQVLVHNGLIGRKNCAGETSNTDQLIAYTGLDQTPNGTATWVATTEVHASCCPYWQCCMPLVVAVQDLVETLQTFRGTASEQYDTNLLDVVERVAGAAECNVAKFTVVSMPCYVLF